MSSEDGPLLLPIAQRIWRPQGSTTLVARDDLSEAFDFRCEHNDVVLQLPVSLKQVGIFSRELVR